MILDIIHAYWSSLVADFRLTLLLFASLFLGSLAIAAIGVVVVTPLILLQKIWRWIGAWRTPQQ